MNEKGKKVLIFGGIALIIAIIGTVFTINYFVSNTLDNLNFKVVAEKVEKDAVLTDTSFILTSEKDYSPKLMKEIVSIEPSVDYTLSKSAKGTYIIKPEKGLEDSSIYNIYINADEDKPALSWAFQTKAEFKVSSVRPYENATYVMEDSTVEITFSKPVDNIKEYFDIYPNTVGRLEYHDKKAVFIPSEFWKEDTVYKVTLKQGLKDIYGDELSEEYSFSFRTRATKPYIYLLDGYQTTFNSKDEQSIRFSGDSKYTDTEFVLNIYQLSSVKEYLDYLKIHYKNVDEGVGEDYDHNFDLSNRTSIYTATTMPLEAGDYWSKYIPISEKLPNGWYIADVVNPTYGAHFQQAIQVTDLSVYVFGIDEEVRIWINDVVTGKEVVGATVQVGGVAAISNKDGVADINVADEERKEIMITTKDGKEFAEYMQVTYMQEPELKDDYYIYAYTDRKVYLPTDKINYWGVIVPRKSGVKIPEEVEVCLDSNLKQTVKVGEKGEFTGTVELINHASTWADFVMKVGERETYMGWVQISDYIKPVYKLSSSFSKDYYRKGEPIELSISGSFFDGTSAQNTKINVSSDGEDKTVMLNSVGEGRVTLKPTSYDESGDYDYIYASLEVDGIDEYSVAYNHTLYFPSDYYLGAEWDASNSKLMLKTNKMNYSAINGKNFDYEKLHSGESFDQDIHAELIETKYEKRYTGEVTYNEYSGTYSPQYVYETIENVLETYDWHVSKDKTFEVYIPDPGDDNTSYRIKMTYKLPDGFAGKKDVYIWYDDYEGQYNYNYFSTDKSSLAENETTRLALENSSEGRLLYIVSTDRINTIGLTNNKYVDVKMSKELIPSCVVSGAFFDGNKVYEVDPRWLYYDTEEKELSIDITTDKDSYRPGDTVKATAKVTDKDGKPVQCNFLYSVVDEAALYEYEDYDNVLSKLYEERYHWPLTYTSDHYENYYGEGGAGGGGDEEIRDTFADVLAFVSTYTDSDGKVDFEFETADNLTSWRITGIAISDDIKAGKTKTNIVTTIPFFINQVLNEKYTADDDVVFSLRVAGQNVPLLSSFVKYDVELLNEKDEVVKTESKTVKPFDIAMINLGKLDLGKYKVKVSAVGGTYSDAILKEFEVTSSLHEISLSKEVNIENLNKVNIKRYPVELMLFDKDNALYYKTLQKIISNTNGGTNEQALARNYAYKKLNEFLGEEKYNTEFRVALQNYDNGISKIQDSSSDDLFTAQVVANAREYINADATKAFFNNKLENTDSNPSEVTCAYMGLAALKEPVLTDVRYLLENEDNFEILETIDLIDALAYLGDYEGATNYYESIIQPLMKENDYEKSIDSKYETFYYQATSRLLPMLALTQHKDFEKVLQYVLTNDTTEYIPVMDLMAFINNYNPATSKSQITYSVLDQEEKVDFSKDKVKFLSLNKPEFDSFTIKSSKGEIKSLVSYVGGADELFEIDSGVSIRKEVTEGSLGGYTDVNLKITLPVDSKYYVVSDVIPSSSRFVSAGSYDYTWGLSKWDGQRVYFYIRSNHTGEININYRIRNVLAGEFSVEPAYITDRSGKVLANSANETVKFKVK